MAANITKRVVIIIFATVGIVGVIILDAIFVSSNLSTSKTIAGFVDFNRYGAFFPMGIAVLMGHWYTPIRDGTPVIRPRWNYLVLGVVAGIMVLVHSIIFIIYYAQVDGHEAFRTLILSQLGTYAQCIACISVLLGLVMGAIFWPVHMDH